MKRANFSTTLKVEQGSEEVYAAINNVRGWWSENVEGRTDEAGGEFEYWYKDIHWCKIKVTELVPGERVVWLITDNYFNFTNDKREWKGTKLVFEIMRKGEETEMVFTHEGLVSDYECYEVCSEAWFNFIQGSLYGLITVGRGKPTRKEENKGFNDRLVEKFYEQAMKVVLITGTSSGLGWLMANTCAGQGHRVYATMRDVRGRNAGKARALAQYPNVEVLEMDVMDGQSVVDAVAVVMGREGRIDVVVNNAGVFAVGITETFTDGDLERVMDVDVKGPWRVMRAVLPYMRHRGTGLMINVSSAAGRFSAPFMAVYNSAKFALEGLTEGLHYEVKPLGVDVVMIQPGAFPTEIFGKIMAGSDAAVIDEYGELASVPEQIGAGVLRMFEAIKPNPQMVADAIVDLINMAPGERPLRTVVDPATGNIVETANRQVREQYMNFMTAIGMRSMLERGFSTSFLVDQSPEEVFAAINKVPKWWSGVVKGDTGGHGSEFVYEVPDVHQSTQRVTEFVPGKKIVWRVTDASLNFVSNREEWKGTDIIFEIEGKGKQTEVRFTHAGLFPDMECYEGCSSAWGMLVNGNLRRLIMTGKTQPSPW